MYFYVRSDGETSGPFTYRVANSHARYLSRENVSGICHLLTYVGARPGDPLVTPTERIVFIYIRGKQSLGGRAAEYNGRRRLA